MDLNSTLQKTEPAQQEAANYSFYLTLSSWIIVLTIIGWQLYQDLRVKTEDEYFQQFKSQYNEKSDFIQPSINGGELSFLDSYKSEESSGFLD